MRPRAQRVVTPQGEVIWIVIDSCGDIAQPAVAYLRYLQNLERSPNTIKSYAGHLALFWDFLERSELNWKLLTLESLAEFMAWLRSPEPGTVSIKPQASVRAESTVNKIITVVYNFYEFQRRSGAIEGIDGYNYQHLPKRRYKPFLHHITKRNPSRVKALKLKEPRRLPKVLNKEQVKTILGACQHLRDKFLITLLYETGIRIGQALGLRLADIRSWDNEILIVPRNDNVNGARAKTDTEYVIHASQPLMEIYSAYLVDEYPSDVDSDYVFVNIWAGQRGVPMTYEGTRTLLDTLRKRTGIYFHWHMFRHTHATELLQHDWNMSFVQKRLGHKSIQTTIDTYAHLNDKDMRRAHQEFLEKWQQQ